MVNDNKIIIKFSNPVTKKEYGLIGSLTFMNDSNVDEKFPYQFHPFDNNGKIMMEKSINFIELPNLKK